MVDVFEAIHPPFVAQICSWRFKDSRAN